MRHRILVTILMAVLAASTVSCDKYALKSEVDELENRVSKLETLCQQMNSNISALQTIVQALEGQDYITSVTPVESEGKTIGYKISFFKTGTSPYIMVRTERMALTGKTVPTVKMERTEAPLS